jgi:CheY-like chemotaxis protein
MMGGVIEVQSTLGAGSRFILTLPCQPGPEPVAMPQSVPVDPAPEVPGHPMEVLVAEDEEVSWFFIKQVLSKQKMKVIRAKDGREAVELCKKHQGIDVVLMDINMPEMNGYEALAEIRKLNPGLPVIAQTAYALSEVLKRLKDSFYDYVTKPIDRKLLLEKILAATGRS